ncbi:MAG: hypothetical protein HY094_09945 [Candidatus Melainabacteria bacterium]|nr:hypothetical protein [Candidatus Melainabacteria bacterium]
MRLYLIFLTFLLSLALLPVNANWKINKDECQCTLKPLPTIVKALLPDGGAGQAFIDIKTGKYLGLAKVDPNGWYKVRGKYLMATFELPNNLPIAYGGVASYPIAPIYDPFLFSYAFSQPFNQPFSQPSWLYPPALPPNIYLYNLNLPTQHCKPRF